MPSLRNVRMLRCTMNLFRPRPAGRFAPAALFHPESVAVIGTGTPLGAEVMRNLRDGGFKGAVLPVDPVQRAVAGVLAYPTVADLPVAPDLAAIADPQGMAATLTALAERGCFAAVVLVPAHGLTELARRTGVRVLGPDSFGVAIPGLGLNASRAHLTPTLGRLALVSQSASLCRAVLDWAGPNGVGFSHIIGIGDNADLGFGAALDWLSRDPGTGAILLDVRRIKNRRAFLSAARAASRLRPVVAIRPGGRLLDPSGTGELAFEAALRRAGVLCVSRLEDLLAVAETLSRARPARGEALAIVTNSISAGRMAADAVLRDGLQLAVPSAETEAVLRMRLPTAYGTEVHDGVQHGGMQHAVTGRPGFADGVIFVGADAPLLLAEIAALLAGAPEVGGILVAHAPAGEQDDAAMAALAACSGTVKLPLLVAAMGETTGAAHRHRLVEAGVVAFATPEQAVRGFLHLVQDRRNRAAARELPPSRVVAVASDQDDVRHLFARLRTAGRSDMAQDEAMAVLAAYGVPTVPCRAVSTEQDAVTAAALLGYPVVVKLRSTAPPGERARGSLALDLHDPAEVRLAARTLTLRQARRAASVAATPEARRVEGAATIPDARRAEGAATTLLVQRQAARGRELLVRVADDPVFGPTIAFGQGGTTAEVQHDIAMDLPPLNLTLAQALIARTRAAGTLAAFRDMPAARIDTVAETLVRISQLIVDFPEIAELEVNPLFVDAQGVLAADAWLRLRLAGEHGVLAIPPYPEALIEHCEARGERLIIRPIRPEDATQHGAFFARLSAEDIRYRFFTAMRELSPEMMARLTQIDYDREMAFVAIRELTGETVGVARLIAESDGTSGEFAVIVQPDLKGKGLASRLMQRLIDWARTRGMASVVGQVLADNAPMLAFVRHLGFSVRRLPEEPDVMEARLELA
jgi:acetyltransferase